MKFIPISPPREFEVGLGEKITLKDCAKIILNANEQVTFITDSKAEYDIVRKEWGFYATPSINGRLKKFGLRAVLLKGRDGKYYVFLVESSQEDCFNSYIQTEGHKIITWLDNEEELKKIEGIFE